MRIISFILTLIISTNFLFAQTEVDLLSDATLALGDIHSLNDSDAVAKHAEGTQKILKRIDKEIKRAERDQESLDDSIARVDAEASKRFESNVKQTMKIFNNKLAFNRLMKKSKEIDPSVTEAAVIQRYQKLTDRSLFDQQKSELLSKIAKSGSYLNFLKEYKTEFIKKSSEAIVGSVKSKADASRSIAGWDEFTQGFGYVMLVSLGVAGVITLLIMIMGPLLGILTVVVLVIGISSIVEAANEKNKARAPWDIRPTDFSVGERVNFTEGESGAVYPGTVTQIMKKYVVVTLDNGQVWNTPATHLKEIKK